jgi:dTDP-4-amino-4,6-dideoxygalactose transaminase
VRVPFCDLPRQYRDLQAELDAAVLGVLSCGDFILGEDVQRFEAEFAAFCGASHCVGVASGTDALHLMLRALQIGPGDEVVTVANTFVATVQAISLAGATPVLADCLEPTGLVDPRALAEALTGRTRAVIAVHLYGQPADVRGLAQACRARRPAAGGRRPGARRQPRGRAPLRLTRPGCGLQLLSQQEPGRGG